MAILWAAALGTLPIDPDYTAGELLDHLSGWLASGFLYPAQGEGPTLRVLNYPPLAFVLARGLAFTGLSPLAAGRLSNALALVALVGVAAAWTRARGTRGAALAGTVGLLGASVPLLYASGQFHIEVWAAAGTVAGFALLDRGPRRWAVAGGVALAMACFTKQTQVVPALVALSWAWRHRREVALSATSAFAVVGVAGSAGITLAWGTEAWRHLLTYTVGTFSLTNLGFQVFSHVLPWVGFLVFAVVTVRAARRDPDTAEPGGGAAGRDALVWYGAAAALWSLSAARVGSSYPYFLDLHLALALWVGPRLFADWTPTLRPGWVLLLSLQVVAADIGAGAYLWTSLDRVRTTAQALPTLCAAFSGHDGPVLAEEAGLARACRRTPVLHPFIVTSLHGQGLWDTESLRERIASGQHGPAVLPFDPRAPVRGAQAQRWTPAMLHVFREAPSVEAAPAGYWVVTWTR